jgi:NitT/TauT family transport system substrate-binding protein
MNGMTEKDVRTVNTSDADIAAVFASEPKARGDVEPAAAAGAQRQGREDDLRFVADPGEIIDLMVVKSNAPRRCARRSPARGTRRCGHVGHRQGRERCARNDGEGSGATLAEFKAQLQTTALFHKPPTRRSSPRAPT